MQKLKFSRIAYQRRYCDLCGATLSKEEVVICEQCVQYNGGVKHD